MITRYRAMEGGITPRRPDSRLRRHDSHQRPVRAGSSAVTFARRARGILVNVLLCALPASGLLAAGHARLAGIYFWTLLCVTLLRLAVSGRCDALLSLLVSLSPFIMLLRDFAIYNIVVVLFAVGVLYYYSRSAGTVVAVVRRCPLARGLFIYATVYYAFSVFLTRNYAANLRMFEVVFVVACILVLGRRRHLLRVALQGFLVCAWLVGIATMPYLGSTDRLGMIVVESYRLGNPGQLGGALACGFLGLAVDRGRWLGLEGKTGPLLGSLILTTALLYLTTSRGSWLVVVAASFVGWVVGRGQRGRILLIIGMVAVTLPTLLLTRYGPGVGLGLERTFGADRSVESRTSGRLDLWTVAYSAFTESPSSLLYGYGPGMGPTVYARHSLTVPDVQYAVGAEMQFHSLFMQIAVETGVLGLAPLAVWCALILGRTVDWTRRYREVLPLAAFVGYLCIGATVGAQGTIAGVFLGVALLVCGRPLQPMAPHRSRCVTRYGGVGFSGVATQGHMERKK
jgi:O-antigen ligase